MGKYEMEGNILCQETLHTLAKVLRSLKKRYVRSPKNFVFACKIIPFPENLPRIISFLQFVSKHKVSQGIQTVCK